MVTALAWMYVIYGDTPQIEALLYGVVPVVIATIVQALIGLRKVVLKSRFLIVLAVAGLTAYLLGVNELVILVAGAAIAALVRFVTNLRTDRLHSLFLPLLATSGLPTFSDPTVVQLAQLFWTMLKIAPVLYGSGYVLIAFLQGDFVEGLG